MGDQQQTPARPPISGPGSGVEKWRAYAAEVTGSPVESWAALSREDVISLLESEGVGQSAADADEVTAEVDTDSGGDPDEDAQDPGDAPMDAETVAAPRRRRAAWMVPTADGWVPEDSVRGR